MEYLVFGLILLAVPFALPLGLWVALYRTRTRMQLLEQALEEQKDTLNRLSAQIAQLRSGAPALGVERPPVVAEPRPIAPPVPRTEPFAPKPAQPPAAPPPPPVARPAAVPPPAPPALPVAPKPAAPPVAPPAAPPIARPPAVPPAMPPVARPPLPQPPAGPPVARPPAGDRPAVPPRVPPPPPPPPPAPSAPSFGLEGQVVKVFSAIAGIALVVGAVSFLSYSLQQGWLQPPVRVLIGLAVAIGLLVVCELKAARKYPATANALDAAAIAILFATFFAAHTRWNLIPGAITFVLFAAVTAIAVLLSIRRESLFIAVLGLLGGFATPALLSTGENRPIPLFAYLVLLNVGLAWVAYRQVWPVLTVLTLVLTSIYQWIWVYRFLSVNDLSLALGIFAVFPVLSVTALLFGRRLWSGPRTSHDETFERTAIVSAALPLVFVGYLAAVPDYGNHPWLLFGFLLLIDAGLLAITIALRRPSLHAVAAAATVFVWAVWLTTSYHAGDWKIAVGFVSAFVVLYLSAPTVAARVGRPFSGSAASAVFAAPALLFVFPVLARIEPAAASPWIVFGPVAALLVLCGWRASVLDRGAVFFTASFFAIAAEGMWSATHLTADGLRPAVIVYAVFGILLTAVPLIARRAGRPLRPEAGGGVVLIASLALLLFLSSGPIAPSALWALALLLAILNAGLFVESASSRLPAVSQAGSVLSWIVLALWWYETAGAVGVLPSLAVLTGLTVITLGGHAWTHSATRGDSHEEGGGGLYLGLIGHAFLYFIALNRQWSIPPWPLFGCLTVVTLATSATSAIVGVPLLHVLGVGAAAGVIATWTAAAGWSVTGIAAASIVSAYALAWMLAGRDDDTSEFFRRGAAVALFGGEITAIIAGANLAGFVGGVSLPAPFSVLLAAHVINVGVLLALVSAAGWNGVAAGALAVAWTGVLEWQFGHDLTMEWRQLLGLAGSLYAVFCTYALVAGPRDREGREPWLVALGATVMAFFAGREAFEAGGLQGIIGVVPVVLGLVTAGLLWSLLRLERAGARDLTRLALVAGTGLALATVAIPLQLNHQWITIGWALEGAALAWLYRRVPHRGLLLASAALLAVVFARLALNPSIWTYEPRGTLRILNWYLYTYLLAAAAMGLAAWWFSRTDDRLNPSLPRVSSALPAAAVILLFLLLNIEIADFYATGPQITFRFGVTVSQDLTYTIGWLGFGMVLLAVGIYVHNRPARIAAVSLIAVTAFKCFLYDLASLGGLYRVASFVGLAIALALVSLALQKFVLARPEASR